MSTTYQIWLTAHARAEEIEAIQDALTEEGAFRFGVTPKLHPKEGVLLDATGKIVKGDGQRAVERMAYELRCAVWLGAQRHVHVEVYYAVVEPNDSCSEAEGNFEKALANGVIQQPCCNCSKGLPFGSQERLCAICAKENP